MPTIKLTDPRHHGDGLGPIDLGIYLRNGRRFMPENDLGGVQPKLLSDPSCAAVSQLVRVPMRHAGSGDGVVDGSAIGIPIVTIPLRVLGSQFRSAAGLAGGHRRATVLTAHDVALGLRLPRAKAVRCGIAQQPRRQDLLSPAAEKNFASMWPR